MELVLKSNDKASIAKIMALAKELNVIIENPIDRIDIKNDKKELKKRILNHNATGNSSFGDALEWQISERRDRDLPFDK